MEGEWNDSQPIYRQLRDRQAREGAFHITIDDDERKLKGGRLRQQQSHETVHVHA